MGVFKRPAKAKKGQKQYWYMRCQHKGREHWESTGKRVGEITKDEALRMFPNWKEEIKTGIKKSSKQEQSSEQVTIYEMAMEYVKQKKSNEKVSWERDVYSINNLLDFFDSSMELQDIDAELIGKYKAHRRRSRKPKTVNHELACLGAIINMAIDRGRFIGKNPVRAAGLIKIKKKKIRVLKPYEDQELINVASVHFGYIIIGALNTAMRRMEIANAHVDHLNLSQGYIYIPAYKTIEDRKVPLNKTMMDLIPILLERSKDGFLWTNNYGYKYKDEHSLTSLFSKYAKKINVKDATFHTLRHTAATRMLEGRMDEKGHVERAHLVDVQTILGHTNPKTTMIYLHPEESLKRAAGFLDQFKTVAKP